jgi:tetratricopeptide (TPR) repeat protein
MVLYNIIKNNINNRPICFANTEDDKFKVGLSSYLMNIGMVSQLVPLQRIAKNKNPRLVDTKNAYENLVKNTAFKPFDSESIHVKSENKSYAREILRKNYFYLAQALIEKNQIEKAKKTIETCLELFPNEELPFNRLAFGLGTLCFRIGDAEKGNEIYRAAMHDMWEELQWITSINPQNPIINATYVKENLLMYQKMNKVMAKFNKELAITHQKNIDEFIPFYTRWYAENWPYEE